MPHFSDCGKPGHLDTYICQVCGQVHCSGCVPSEWRPDITGNSSAGNVCRNCLNTRGNRNEVTKVTKSAIKTYLKKRLKEPKQAVKALLKVYEFQTASEQQSESTREHNNVGFSAYHANILSKFAKQYQERKRDKWPENRLLSEKQIKIVTEIMPKYWRQIAEVSNRDALENQVLRFTDMVEEANENNQQYRLNLI